MIFCPRYMDSSVCETIDRVSNLFTELRSNILIKRKYRFIGFVGDWGVGKDSLALRVLDMDIPNPKLEVDHPSVRRRYTRYIRNIRSGYENYDLTIRIIPGKYINRERDEHIFDYIHRDGYEFDLLVFCFALNNLASFESLRNKWIPNSKVALAEKMPFSMMIGTKCDMPDLVVSEEEARDLRERSNAFFYSISSAHDDIEIIEIRNMIITSVSYR